MKFSKVLLGFSIVFLSCATQPSPQVSNTPAISLAQVEALEMGKVNSVQVLAKFGSPQKILKDVFSDEDVWVYSNLVNGESLVRLTLSVSKSDGIVSGAVWIPLSNDDFFKQEKIIQHFSKLNFVKKKMPATSRHEQTDDFEYSDRTSGVTVLFKYGNKVDSISFSEPNTVRVPARAASQKI